MPGNSSAKYVFDDSRELVSTVRPDGTSVDAGKKEDKTPVNNPLESSSESITVETGEGRVLHLTTRYPMIIFFRKKPMFSFFKVFY